MSERLTVITIPQATANGPLHLGHLSGPYLASDIAARAARARGERVVALAGIDVHQNYVLTKAENEGVPVEDMIEEYRTRILDAYTRARLSWGHPHGSTRRRSPMCIGAPTSRTIRKPA